MSEYDASFYEGQEGGSRLSAQAVLPVVFSMMERPPRSVIDVGCGVGAWLATARSLGVEHIHGVDGNYVPRERLYIPGGCFEPHDLATRYTPARRYDLAMSLEVAEHLPEHRAESFVRDLTALAPVVLFSAAIPYQSGTSHINCQWPEYWIRLFANDGYRVVDRLRPQIWSNVGVEWWYAQNAMLFVGPNASLGSSDAAMDWLGTALVHPRLFVRVAGAPVTLRKMLSSSPALLKQVFTSAAWRARRALRRFPGP